MKKTSLFGLISIAALWVALLYTNVSACGCEGDQPAAVINSFAGGYSVNEMMAKPGSIIISENTTTYNEPFPLMNPYKGSVYTWAQKHELTNFPIGKARLLRPVGRYELARMLVMFTKNIQQKTIERSLYCNPQLFADAYQFTQQMLPVVFAICDLGYMGRGVDAKTHNDIPIENFRPFYPISDAELAITMRRMFGEDTDLPEDKSLASVLKFLYGKR